MPENESARGPTDESAYTMRQALKEACELLDRQFGEIDQEAAVSLATFLYGAHARDVFLEENPPETEMAYGGGL